MWCVACAHPMHKSPIPCNAQGVPCVASLMSLVFALFALVCFYCTIFVLVLFVVYQAVFNWYAKIGGKGASKVACLLAHGLHGGRGGGVMIACSRKGGGNCMG